MFSIKEHEWAKSRLLPHVDLGYEVFGKLEGYAEKHERYYLRKEL